MTNFLLALIALTLMIVFLPGVLVGIVCIVATVIALALAVRHAPTQAKAKTHVKRNGVWVKLYVPEA